MLNKFLILVLLYTSIILYNGSDSIAANKSQTTANVGIYLVDIDDVNLESQTFYAELYLNMDWPSKGRSAENVDFYTSKDIDISHVTKWNKNDTTYYACKVKGNFKTEMLIKKFPFDEQELVVYMSDFLWNEDSLRYNFKEKYSGYSKGINILGWEVLSHETSVFTLTDFGDKYSTIRYKINIARESYESFYKIFFPLITILFVAYLGLVIPRQEFSTRVSLGITSLLSIIALHFTISSLFAELNFPTKVDTVIFICYLLIALNICLMIVISKINDSGRESLAEKVNKYGQIYSPVVYIVIGLIFVFTW